MKNLRLAGATAIAAAITLFASGAAQAYPDCGIDLQIKDATLVGGKTFNFTAKAGATNCAWTVTYRGETKTGNGTTFSGTFSTPVVTKKTKNALTADCKWNDGVVAPAAAKGSTVSPAFYSTAPAANVQAVERTCPTSATVTLLPKGGVGDNGASLPDTGGSNLSLLLLGGGLLLVGGGVTYAARRRHTSH